MVNPLVSHEDGRPRGRWTLRRSRARWTERRGRGRGAKRRFHGGWAQRGQLVPLYACEPRRRDIAPRDTHAGGRGRGHRVGAERDYRCKSPRTKGSLLVPLWRNKSPRSLIEQASRFRNLLFLLLFHAVCVPRSSFFRGNRSFRIGNGKYK